MRKVSLALITVAAASLSVLPANAVETTVNSSEQIDATQQIKDVIEPGFCFWVPGYGRVCI